MYARLCAPLTLLSCRKFSSHSFCLTYEIFSHASFKQRYWSQSCWVHWIRLVSEVWILIIDFKSISLTSPLSSSHLPLTSFSFSNSVIFLKYYRSEFRLCLSSLRLPLDPSLSLLTFAGRWKLLDWQWQHVSQKIRKSPLVSWKQGNVSDQLAMNVSFGDRRLEGSSAHFSNLVLNVFWPYCSQGDPMMTRLVHQGHSERFTHLQHQSYTRRVAICVFTFPLPTLISDQHSGNRS